MRSVNGLAYLERFSMRSIFSAFFILLMSNAAAVAQGDTSAPGSVPASFQASEDRYRIGFQDTLEVQIFRHPELNQRVNVNTNGTITLFRLDQPIVAVCKSERELANEIAAAYAKNYLRNPEVNVIAVEQRSQAFAVMGAVEKPANYFINRPIRLLELLAQALDAAPGVGAGDAEVGALLPEALLEPRGLFRRGGGEAGGQWEEARRTHYARRTGCKASAYSGCR